MTNPYCCYIEDQEALNALGPSPSGEAVRSLGCQSDAEWVIADGPAPHDYTEACTAHVGMMLTDGLNTVYPIEGQTT